MSGAGSAFGGMQGGRLFFLPSWIDPTQPPLATSQPVPAWTPWARNVAQFRHLIFSPNLGWFLISVLSYICFPYDFDAAKAWGLDWVCRRLLVNLLVMASYYSFWEVSLYGMQVCV